MPFKTKSLYAALLCFLYSLTGVAQTAGPLPQTPDIQNRPYVVLVSLDGFRYDYAEKYQAAHLLAIRDAGAGAKSLIPPYPSLTFPSHTSIMTGLYPEHHGIVDNEFWDAHWNESFRFTKQGNEGKWYGGVPLWVLAEQQGMRTATFFWPGSDGAISGVRPTQWRPYDGQVPNEQRAAQLVEWLRLPAAQRPHFLTMYISDVDHAGHEFGPESAEVKAAVQQVDQLIGHLWEQLQALPIAVNLIVVSDHGMQEPTLGLAQLSEYADLRDVHTNGTGGPQVLIYSPNVETTDTLYAAFKDKSPLFTVYRRQETPPEWHYASNPRAGDLILVAKQACFLATAPQWPNGSQRKAPKGAHGYDPRLFPTMHGIFYAAGPNIRPGTKIDSFENIHIYPLVTTILGLTPPAKLDGSPAVLEKAYAVPARR